MDAKSSPVSADSTLHVLPLMLEWGDCGRSVTWAQNGARFNSAQYFRANQNAERLHGAMHHNHVQSAWRGGSHTLNSLDQLPYSNAEI